MYDLFILPQLTGMTSICRGEMCIRDCVPPLLMLLLLLLFLYICGWVSIYLSFYSFGARFVPLARSYVDYVFSRKARKKKCKERKICRVRCLNSCSRCHHTHFFFTAWLMVQFSCIINCIQGRGHELRMTKK